MTGLSLGQSAITATSGVRTGTANVCVTGPLRVSNAALSLVAGRTVQIAATGTGGGTVSYSSGAPSIATVDGAGLVRGVGVGQATITVRLTGASGSETLPVTVTVSASSIAVSPTNASASVNATARFTAIVQDANGVAIPGVPVAWTISDPTVGTLLATNGATVDVRALKVGSTVVRATLGNLTASAQFNGTTQLPAVGLQKVSGDNGTCATRSTTCVFVARAIDVNGVAVPNTAITWSAAGGCGQSRVVSTDAQGLSTTTNICSSVPAGAYTQTAALPNNLANVSFAFSLRGLILTLKAVDDSAGTWTFDITSPTPATGLTYAAEYISGPGANYVTQLELNRNFTPATLIVGIDGSNIQSGPYTFNVVVSTTTPGVGPGMATIPFFNSSGLMSPPVEPNAVSATRTKRQP